MDLYTFTTGLEGGGVSAAQAAGETKASSMAGSASALTVGAFEAGGGNTVDFWRIALTGGDKASFSVAGPAGARYAFELYSPETTGQSFTSSNPVVRSETSGANETITLQAPYSGTFLLAVCENPSGSCATGFSGYLPSKSPMDPYTFTTGLEGGGVSPTQAASETRASSLAGSAPALTIGAFEAGGGNTVDFWRIALATGDKASFSVAGPAGARYKFELYSPETTGQSFTSSNPVAQSETSGAKETITLQAPSSGNFLLAVCENPDGTCAAGFTGYLPSKSPMDPYTFTTAVATASPAAASLALVRQRVRIARSGSLTIKVTCSGAPCSGRLRLTTLVKRLTGKGRHRKRTTTAVLIGSASFSNLSPGIHGVSVKLNDAGLRLLRHDDYAINGTREGHIRIGRVICDLKRVDRADRHTPEGLQEAVAQATPPPRPVVCFRTFGRITTLSVSSESGAASPVLSTSRTLDHGAALLDAAGIGR